MLDLFNNKMFGDVPDSVQNLTSLQYLYLDNQHYRPLRQKYCRQRLPNNGKYSYLIVRQECAAYLDRTGGRAAVAVFAHVVIVAVVAAVAVVATAIFRTGDYIPSGDRS